MQIRVLANSDINGFYFMHSPERTDLGRGVYTTAFDIVYGRYVWVRTSQRTERSKGLVFIGTYLCQASPRLQVIYRNGIRSKCVAYRVFVRTEGWICHDIDSGPHIRDFMLHNGRAVVNSLASRVIAGLASTYGSDMYSRLEYISAD